MKNLTVELIEKAKAAKSAEELLEIAKANNVELTEEQAKTYFEQLSANGAVDDDALDAVAGGSFLGISCPSDEEAEKPVALAGKTVRVLDGKRCRKCHSDVGIVGHNALAGTTAGNSLYVGCPKCNLVITYNVDNIEIL